MEQLRALFNKSRLRYVLTSSGDYYVGNAFDFLHFEIINRMGLSLGDVIAQGKILPEITVEHPREAYQEQISDWLRKMTSAGFSQI